MSTAGSAAARLRALARDVVRATRGHDLALYAAGVTFYAAVGLVPLLLLALYLAGLLVGQDTVRSLAATLVGLLPSDLGTQDAGRALAEAGTRLTPWRALAATVAASLYGEGLVRAFDRLSVRGEGGRRSLRGRLGALVVVAVSPLLLLVGLTASSGLSQALGDSVGDRLLGIYVAFVVGWLSISLLLAFAYRALAAERPGARALAWGSLSTGSFLSGTCLGFVLFLSLGIDLGGAYGGARQLATAVACLGWLLVLHVVVLVGYVLTLCLDAREGRPLGPPVTEDQVREAV